MKQLTRLAGRIFGTPLLIQPQKLEVILKVLGPRIGLSAMPMDDMPDDMPDDPMKHRQVPGGIAVIDIFGPLVKRASGEFLSGGPTTYAEIEGQFLAALDSDVIQGILLNIDSPGGEVGGAYELADLIFSERDRKPCFAVANDDAFSAGYLLASSAERVYVSNSGGVGSIGTLALHIDQSGYDEKLGAKYTYITAGERKADLNPHEPISNEAYVWLKAEIDRLNDIFVSTIVRNRRLTPSAIRAQQAMPFFGPNAVAEGLADETGSFMDALAALSDRIATKAAMSSVVASATAVKSVVMEVPMSKATKPQAEAEVAKPVAEEQPAEVVQAAVEAEGAAEALPEPAASAIDVSAAPASIETASSATIEQIREAVAAETWAQADALVELCQLAGDPGVRLLPEFIRERVGAEIARKRLLAEKVASCGPEISSRAGMGEGDAAEQYKTLAEQRAKDKGIPFHQAYEQVVRENPAIYQQYLATRQAIQPK